MNEMGINNSNFSFRPYLSLIDDPQPAQVFSFDADSGGTRSFNISTSRRSLQFLPKKAPLHTPPCEGGQSMVQSANWSLIPCNQQAPLKLVLGAFFFPFELHWTGLYFLGADRVVVVFVVSYKVAATIIYLFLHARAQLPTTSHRKELYI